MTSWGYTHLNLGMCVKVLNVRTMKEAIKVRMFVVFFYTNYEWCRSARRILTVAKILYYMSMFKKNNNKKKKEVN